LKRITKKFLALLLTLTMLIGFFPVLPAIATNTPFTPGSGGAMPTMPTFTANPDTGSSTFAGLSIKDSERWTGFPSGYRATVDLIFPAPSVFGATSYDLYYSADGETGWMLKDGCNTAGDNFSIYPDASYYYRLLAHGGTIDGYTSNIVYAPAEDELINGDNTYFSSLSLDESFNYSPTRTMCPFVGRGLNISATVKSLVSHSEIIGGISFQWYRVNPGTYEANPISGATHATYLTTNDDLGYKIMAKVIGNETTVNGFYQIFSSSDIQFPNETYASAIDGTGFTLNLKHVVPGLTASDLALTCDGSPIAITSVTEIGDGASDNAVFRVSANLSGVSSSSSLFLNNTSGTWKISSKMGPTQDLILGLSIEMPSLPMPDTATFSGDADHIYFAGDTLNFSLTRLPVTISGPVRVAFGVLDSGGIFTPANVISGLTSEDSGVRYFAATNVTGGTFTAPIIGTIQSGLSNGVIAVKLYAQKGTWVDVLDYTHASPAYIPLSLGDKPAMVGFDNVLLDEMTTDPVLNTISDFYSSSLNIKFIKNLGGGDTGSILFAGINLADRTAMAQLASLRTALLIQKDTPAAGSGIDRQFTFSVNDTALSALANVGATISVTAASFAGLSAENFNLGAAEVGGPAYLVRSFNSSTNTISFTVPHFSGYTLTIVDAAAAVAVQNLITAIPAIGTLLLTDTGVSTARSAYNALTAAQKLLVTNYAVLTAAEAQITSLGNATTAVVTAETTPTQANADTAQALVTALPSGTTKAALQSRINTVQAALNTVAISAINAADTATIANVITAKTSTLGLSLTDYNSLTDKAPVYTALIGKAFTNKTEIRTAFETAVAAEKVKEAPISGGGSSPVPKPEVEKQASGGTTTASATLPGTTDSKTGITSATVTENTAKSLLDNAVEAEKAGQKAVVEIDVSTTGDSTGTQVNVPRGTFDHIAQNTNADVQVSTVLGKVTFDSSAVESISGAANGGDIKIGINVMNSSTLSQRVQQIVGDRPVCEFSVTAGSSQITTFGGGSVTVGIPYTPAQGEDLNALVVYYIDNSGSLKAMQGAYNSATGLVEFTTTHFSKYAVGYNKVTYTDVSASAWYSNAVTFCAARGITTGLGGNMFGPDNTLTRGQFIVMLMRAYGIESEENPTDNFSDAGNTYYTSYLAAAKKLGISNGVGNNMSAPDIDISRQDMFTLLYRTLDILGKLPEENSGKSLSGFSDSQNISDYAVKAFDTFVSKGIVSGSNGELNPGSNCERAQMVQVLYHLLSK